MLKIVRMSRCIVLQNPLVCPVTMSGLHPPETHLRDPSRYLVGIRPNNVVVRGRTRSLAQRTRPQPNAPVHHAARVGTVPNVVHNLDLVGYIQLNLSGPTLETKKTFQFYFQP